MTLASFNSLGKMLDFMLRFIILVRGIYAPYFVKIKKNACLYEKAACCHVIFYCLETKLSFKKDSNFISYVKLFMVSSRDSKY